MDNELFVRIRFLLPSLPRAEKVVAQAVLENPEDIVNFTLADLARETGSSDASVIRLCKRLGYDGYTSLKENIVSAFNEGNSIVPEEINATDDMQTVLKKVYQSNMQSLSDTVSLASDDYDRALKALVEAKSIHFYGCGDAAAVCQLAHIKFGRLGFPGSADTDAVLQLMEAGNLGPRDVAFAVSYEGRSRTVVDAMRVAKERGATTICITKMNKSPLLKVTDIPLFIATSDLTVCRDIVARRVADQMIIDALYLGVLSKNEKKYKEKLGTMRKITDCNKVMRR